MRRAHTVSTDALLADIRAKCLDCMCGSRKLVDTCTSRECRLWRHRKGLAGEQEGMFAQPELEGQMDIFELEVCG